jgi:L-aspartate oxidase
MAFNGQTRIVSTDFLVVGAGIAGLRAAVELAEHGDVLVVTKESLGESNTFYAQGGIAVAMAGDEDVALHLEDTIAAGDGLVDQAAAEVLVAEGPVRVAELLEWGAKFDREGGVLMRTREGAHSQPRILHANGDATGAEISRALLTLAQGHKRIRFADWTMVSELLVRDGRVVGAELFSKTDDGQQCAMRVSAKAVLLASGGAGQVYSDTTNPAVATGDGMALALEAGAELADMEFYQFHPTALSLPGVARFLMSEALRGEGAWLRNEAGERFMDRYHALLELAPRDVVARAIAREGMSADGAAREVYLDMRHVRGVDLHKRFPGISRFLAQHGLDLHRDLIPVRPAAHYMMGGVRTDLDGRTTVAGLYAAGEVACTGVHGANRLASNSLLEGLVFGARAAKGMLSDLVSRNQNAGLEVKDVAVPELDPDSEERVERIIARLRAMMWRNAGLLRDAALLREGLALQAEIAAELDGIAAPGARSRRLYEARFMAAVAKAMLTSALGREESRGAHFREDFPKRDDARFGKHSVVGMSGEVRFQSFRRG